MADERKELDAHLMHEHAASTSKVGAIEKVQEIHADLHVKGQFRWKKEHAHGARSVKEGRDEQ